MDYASERKLFDSQRHVTQFVSVQRGGGGKKK